MDDVQRPAGMSAGLPGNGQSSRGMPWPFLFGPHLAPVLTVHAKGKAFPRYFTLNPYVPAFQHYLWQSIHPLGAYFVPQPPYYPHDCEWDGE
jgi:hypothetical protein